MKKYPPPFVLLFLLALLLSCTEEPRIEKNRSELRKILTENTDYLNFVSQTAENIISLAQLSDSDINLLQQLTSDLLTSFNQNKYTQFITISKVEAKAFTNYTNFKKFIDLNFEFQDEDLVFIISENIEKEIYLNLSKSRREIPLLPVMAATCSAVCTVGSQNQYPDQPDDSPQTKDINAALRAAYFTGCFHHCMGWL